MVEEKYVVYTVIKGDYPVEKEALAAASWQALDVAQAEEPCSLSITITSSEHIQELNVEYAGIDKPTDVLSFAAEDEPYEVEPGEPPYLGDVIIAYPVAERQAAAAGHSVEAELQTLAIHGTLHLLGFDHQTPDQQAEMWAYESAARDTLREEGW